MRKVDLISLRKEKNSVIPLNEIRKDLITKWDSRISRTQLKENELKIFFKTPVSLFTIDKALDLIVDVKEMKWRYEKKIRDGTYILEVLIE